MSLQPPFYGHPNLPLERSPLHQNLAASVPTLTSIDNIGDENEQPLDSTRPQNNERPLPIDWSGANEVEQHNLAQPASINNTMHLAKEQHRQSRPQGVNVQLLTAAINQPLPMTPVSFTKETIEDTQATVVNIQRSTSILGLQQATRTAETQHPTNTVEVAKPLVSIVPDQLHAFTKDNIPMATRVSISSPIPGQNQINLVSRNGARSGQMPAFNLKRSIRNSIRRTASRAFGGIFATLRIVEDRRSASEPSDVNKSMTEWKTLLSQHERQRKMMEGAYEPFRARIEEAFDSKYVELRGQGRFLIEDESMYKPVKRPIELPVEEKQAPAPNEDEIAWLMHWKRDQEITESRDPRTSSLWRAGSRSESLCVENVCSAPRLPQTAVLESKLTYAADLPTLAKTAPSEEPEPGVSKHHDSTQGPMDNCGPLKSDLAIDDERTRKFGLFRGSRLPKPTVAGANGSSTTDCKKSNVHLDAAKTDAVPKSRTRYKSRKDSVQPGASQSARPAERYPKIRTVPKR